MKQNSTKSSEVTSEGRWKELLFRTSIFEILGWGVGGKDAVMAQVEALPAAGKDLILRVVRRARLWKRERVDVAAELASHFREGLANGAPIEDLVRDFGDEKTTARLIRRGMRRKRPLAWKVWFYWTRGVVALIGVLVGAYVFLYGRAFIDTPSVKRNFVAEWNAETRRIAEVDRAAPLYAKANAAIVNTPGVKEGLRYVVERDARRREWAVSKAFLDANPKMVEMIREAARKPHMGIEISDADPSPEWQTVPAGESQASGARGPSENPVLFAVLLPHLGPMRQMGRMLMQDAVIAAEAGDAGRVVEDWSSILRMSRHAAEDRTLIGQLVGVALMDMVFRDVVSLVQKQPGLLDAAQLRAIAHEIAGAGLREREGDFRIEFSRESAMLEDVLQRVFTDDGSGDGRLAPRGMVDVGAYLMPEWSNMSGLSRGGRGEMSIGPIAPIAVVWSAGRRETLTAFHELLGAYEAQRAIPLWKRDGVDPLPEAMSKFDGGRNSRYFVLQTVLPSFGRMIAVERELVQTRDVAVVSVAMAAYHREHGMWPATLDELVPSYLPRVPLDGFDGKPLKYRLLDGKPLLYSIGLDFEDNQGKAALTEGAARDLARMEPGIALPAGASHSDVVYWPRPEYPRPSPPLE